jgi:hypothetical protein
VYPLARDAFPPRMAAGIACWDTNGLVSCPQHCSIPTPLLVVSLLSLLLILWLESRQAG